MKEGGCHCGAVRYGFEGETQNAALCHCGDCRRSAGAPMVGWLAIEAAGLKVSGTPKVYRSSEHGERHFCADCGTGLFYYNEAVLPGLVDIQMATLDEADAVPATAHIQWAERLDWTEAMFDLPKFERYPEGA